MTLFHHSGGDILTYENERVPLEDALTYAQTSASKYRRALRDGEIEAANFYRIAARDLGDAIVAASNWNWAWWVR